MQRFDLGMHFDPSAQANWSEGQERASEVTSSGWTTPSWMLMMLVVISNCKFAIAYKALEQSYDSCRRERLKLEILLKMSIGEESKRTQLDWTRFLKYDSFQMTVTVTLKHPGWKT